MKNIEDHMTELWKFLNVLTECAIKTPEFLRGVLISDYDYERINWNLDWFMQEIKKHLIEMLNESTKQSSEVTQSWVKGLIDGDIELKKS